MTALLALIPARIWLYLGLAAVFAGAFGWYTVHERHIEHVKDIAAATAVVNKDNAIVAADDASAKTSEAQNVLIYKQAVSIPAVADIGIVCQRAPGSIPLPAADSVTSAAAGNATADGGKGPSFDPTGAALTRARNADAQIVYLQRRVAELEKQMNEAP